MGLYASPIKTVQGFIDKLKDELIHVKEKLYGQQTLESPMDLVNPNQQDNEDQSSFLVENLSGGSETNKLEQRIDHFAPSMVATVAAPADATATAINAGADTSMGNISELGDANNGFGIGLSAFGQITSLSSLILSIKRLITTDDKDEKAEAGEEILNSAIALFKSTASMADTIVKMQGQAAVNTAAQNVFTTFFSDPSNAEALAQSINDLSAVKSGADAAATATGSVAVAAGILWNAYQLVINAKEAHKAGTALKALTLLNQDSFVKAQEYAKARLKRKQIRRAVNAASSGLGLVAGAVGIAILAGVAATPAGWALMAAGLMIGVGILGYKIGKYIYKKRHRNNKASNLVIDLNSPIKEDRTNAEIYVIQVLGMDVQKCRQDIEEGRVGKLQQEIIQRMENKRLVIASQLLQTIKDEESPDYDGAIEIITALGMDVDKLNAMAPDKAKQKIIKSLSAW